MDLRDVPAGPPNGRQIYELACSALGAGRRVYFSDTLPACFLYTTRDGRRVTDGFYRMTRTFDLTDYLNPNFCVEQQARWHWEVPGVGESHRVAKLFKVQGMVLSIHTPNAAPYSLT
jgi:hypothetical protein